jgi:DNA polymerase elongation subunit (family B)
LDDKNYLMETFIMLCYMAGISFDKAIAQDISWLRIHDAAIYRYCKENGMELPTAVKVGYGEEENTFTGAYVKTPVPDLYDYVTVFDVASLYPSCIRSLNISIDSYRGKIKSISGKPIKEAFDKNFNLIKGVYEVEFYDPLHLSLKDFEQTLIQRANNKLKNKIDPNIGNPKKMIFDHGDNFLSYLKVNKLCVGANGTIFTTERRGVIPSLLDSWIAIRKKNKNLYFEYKKKHQETGDIQYKKLSERYKTIQDVYKIRLNSLYGFIGTKYSRFFNVDLSEAVTLTGQLILKSTEAALKNANVFFDALYCDTDSIFIHYGKILKVRGIDLNDKEACVATCKQIDIEVKTVIDNHLNMITGSIMNTPNYYSFESEEIYEKLLITSKKKYVAKTLYDKVNNAFVTNDYNIKGMDFKKSNLSKPIKDLLRNITIKIMGGMTESEVLAHFKDIWNKIPEFPIDDIAFAQKVDGLGKYGTDTVIEFNSPTNANVVFPLHCPYHVAGALALNALIDFDNDLHDMTKAVNGDKAKIIFVTPKNIMTVESVAYVGKWNPKLYDYFKLDIEKIFLRTILQPMQPVLDAMKFKITLDSILGFKFTDSENTVKQLLLF